jgi:hypothetical protein
MAAKPCEPLNLHDQDAVNFQKDDTTVDSDADDDNDRPHFRKVEAEVWRKAKVYAIA